MYSSNKISNTKIILSSIVYGLIFSISFFPPESNVIHFVVYLTIIEPVLIIISLILFFITKQLIYWWKLYLLLIIFSISGYISNIFIVPDYGGKVYIFLPELVLKLIAMILCYFFIFKIAKLIYNTELHRAALYIILTIALIQILIFSYEVVNVYMSLIYNVYLL